MTEGALVLEGGSLRSMFTAGVLDVFMEQGIEMCYVNGVSAGTMCSMSYISKQIGRTRQINLDYIRDRRFMSFQNMMKNRTIFNFDFMFDELSRDLVPYDFDAFYQSAQRYVVVATRCKTGKPEYFEKGICPDMISAIKASCSMPVMSKMVDIAGKKYLDGGISMPVAYHKAMEEGYEKIVVVLTRNKGYRKKAYDRWTKKAYERYFKPLPKLLDALMEVPERYNRMQEEIDQLEADGKIFVIRPIHPVIVSRTEQDKKKLDDLYLEGRQAVSDQMKELKAYLGIEEV